MLTLATFMQYVSAVEPLKIYNLDTLEEFKYDEATNEIPVLDDEDDWSKYHVIGFYSDYNKSKDETFIRVNIRRSI